jgi:hypothetical protein
LRSIFHINLIKINGFTIADFKGAVEKGPSPRDTFVAINSRIAAS